MTVQEAFDLALDHHRAGRLAEAELLYRQILAAQPDHADAVHAIGVIANQVGRHDLAIEWIQRAIAVRPNDPAAFCNLGEAYRSLGRPGAAIPCYHRALELNPNLAAVHNNLGAALAAQGQQDDAIASYRRALQLQPDYPEAHGNLGDILKQCGRLDEAAEAYRRAIQLRPQSVEFHHRLGLVMSSKREWSTAISCYRAVLRCQPDSPEICHSLGVALHHAGHFEEAAATYQELLRRHPDLAETWYNLGVTYTEQRAFESAINAYQRAVEINPNYPAAWNNLGNALRETGRLDEAVTAFHRALQYNPDLAETHANLGNTLKDQGLLHDAIAAYRHARDLAPQNPWIQSNLIFALHLHPGESSGDITAEQRRWNLRFGKPAEKPVTSDSHDRNPHRRLRIGYVSPDFRDHVLGRNLLCLFEAHDRQNFEIIGYSAVTHPDEITRKFQESSAQWRNIAGITDEAAAAMIREDRVDVLVDLMQHMAGNRLPIFSKTPAPVQVSFGGYPATAGVDAIPFRISDRYLESETGDEKSEIGWKSEPELRSLNSGLRAEHIFLIDSFWCYDPCGMEVEVNELPAGESGTFTFGSLNSFCKVNDLVLNLWAQILQLVPDSRLVLLSHGGRARERTTKFLIERGIESNRLEFVRPCPRKDYLAHYHQIDVALDPFPYGGHTTSLDALWMGVPVVSLAGEQAVSRAGLSILNNLGLSNFVAFSENDYIKFAAELAADLRRLKELRRTLRGRMESSVLMNAPRFARQIETAYRSMWGRWCTTDAGQ
jgi:predicted O-linked N-acetylglucosamine transferase (SPINDLY family)